MPARPEALLEGRLSEGKALEREKRGDQGRPKKGIGMPRHNTWRSIKGMTNVLTFENRNSMSVEKENANLRKTKAKNLKSYHEGRKSPSHSSSVWPWSYQMKRKRKVGSSRRVGVTKYCTNSKDSLY